MNTELRGSVEVHCYRLGGGRESALLISTLYGMLIRYKVGGGGGGQYVGQSSVGWVWGEGEGMTDVKP